MSNSGNVLLNLAQLEIFTECLPLPGSMAGSGNILVKKPDK